MTHGHVQSRALPGRPRLTKQSATAYAHATRVISANSHVYMRIGILIPRMRMDHPQRDAQLRTATTIRRKYFTFYYAIAFVESYNVDTPF